MPCVAERRTASASSYVYILIDMVPPRPRPDGPRECRVLWVSVDCQLSVFSRARELRTTTYTQTGSTSRRVVCLSISSNPALPPQPATLVLFILQQFVVHGTCPRPVAGRSNRMRILSLLILFVATSSQHWAGAAAPRRGKGGGGGGGGGSGGGGGGAHGGGMARGKGGKGRGRGGGGAKQVARGGLGWQ